MLSKKYLGIIIAIIAISALGLTIAVFAANNDKLSSDSTISDAFDKMDKAAKEDAKLHNKAVPTYDDQVILESPYDKHLNDAKLDKSIKDKVQKLKNKSCGIGVYMRELKRITGSLPKDQTRITKDEFMKTIKDVTAKKAKKSDLLNVLDEINGAPDWVGGSGITSIQYYSDDSGNQRIVFFGGETGTIALQTFDQTGNITDSILLSNAGEDCTEPDGTTPVYQSSPITENMPNNNAVIQDNAESN